MAQEAQLYIDGQRIDLFSDESIQITSSIQDVKDIAKIFSDYTKPFSVKASRNNNLVFKHYHDGSIIDGYDARFRSDAVLELNYTPFRKGTVRLNKVLMRNNKAYAYDLTFFGGTVTLTRLLGESLLSSLDSYLSNYDHNYTDANILAGFSSGLTLNSQANAVIYPFITSEYRMVYDSALSALPEKTRNVYDYRTSNEAAGLHSTDLKPAIKLIHIIEAIESKYPEITFSRDFFGTTDFTELYMWLHREKGNISSDELRTTQINTINPEVWQGVTTTTNSFIITNTGAGYCAADAYGTSITINVSETSASFDLRIEQDGESFFNETGLTGESSYAFSVGALTDGEYKVFLTTQDSFTLSGSLDFSFIADPECPNAGDANTVTIGSLNSLAGFTLRIAERVPEIKIIDFLSGLFKMFNLTAYKNDNGVIVVDTLDNFYSGVNTSAGVYDSYDITQYLDMSTSEVNRLDLYSEITFKFKDPSTFLAAEYFDRFNKHFGGLYYNGKVSGQYIDGVTYSIELPFEKLMYEKLTNAANGMPTNISYGWFVSEDQNTTAGAPLIFYRVNQSVGGSVLRLKNLNDDNETSISTYNRASNVKSSGTQTLHFGGETDEYTGLYNGNSLFENFYSNYITSIFNRQNRILKIGGYLPLKVLTSYKLSDRFIVNNESYKINSVTTNLYTNKTELELIKDL